MNARQAKKAQAKKRLTNDTERLVEDKDFEKYYDTNFPSTIKKVIKIKPKKTKKRVKLTVKTKPSEEPKAWWSSEYEDALRSGFARMGLIDPQADMEDLNSGIASSIRNNLKVIGNEKCDNVKGYENETWLDITVRAMGLLDAWQIVNAWVGSYFRVAPTYGGGETDATRRQRRFIKRNTGRKPIYITQPTYGREVFRIWAENLAYMETGKVQQSIIDF